MNASRNNDQATQSPKRPRRRRAAIAGVAVVLVLFVACAAFAAYASDYYPAEEVEADLTGSAQVPVQRTDGYVAFGDPASPVGLVFYPGAKVEYTAYAPLMHDLAERGYFAAVVAMPFNFAFFDVDAATRIREAFPDVGAWWVGGHSLGGSMAAQYAAGHADELDGVVLLAAYPASDLSRSGLGGVVVYGTSDQVLNRDKLHENESLLPEGSLVVEIPEGNHANFGSYGDQEGDGASPLSPTEQQEITADLVDGYVSTWYGQAAQAA